MWWHCNKNSSDCAVNLRLGYEKQSVRAAFFKLWSADHKWSSGSALVVLLD
jgi:hypothetical protein